MKRVTIAEVEYVAYALAKELMNWDEPIPDFGARFPNILESCLMAPFHSFGGRPAYKGLAGKAAILFYLLVKNHPFQNGNKRIAMTALLYFLYKNKKWLEVDSQEFYNFAKWIASSPPKLKGETVLAIERFLRTYLAKI